MRLYTKRGSFQIFQTKCVLSQVSMEICEKFCIFWINFWFFLIKKIGVIVRDKFATFDQKLETNGIIGWRSKLFRGNWARSEHKKGVWRALHSVPSNMGVHPGFISNYNLNFTKYLSAISIFATLAGGHKCIKEYLECPNKSGNPRHSAKVLNSDVYTARLLLLAMWYPITQLLHWYLHWSNSAALVR